MQLGELAPAADEARDLGGKFGRRNLSRDERRKLVGQIGMSELVNVFRSGHVTQDMGSEVAEPDTLGQAVGNEVPCRLRDQDLAPVAQVAQAGTAVHGRPGVVALVTQLDVAGMQRDAETGFEVAGPDLFGDGPLEVDSTGDSRGGTGKGQHEAVALALLHRTNPAVLRRDRRDHRVQTAHSLHHRRCVTLPRPDRPLEVSENQGHRADRQSLRHDLHETTP